MSEKQQHRMFGSFPEATVVAQCWNACWAQAIYNEILCMRMYNMECVFKYLGYGFYPVGPQSIKGGSRRVYT